MSCNKEKVHSGKNRPRNDGLVHKKVKHYYKYTLYVPKAEENISTIAEK